MVKQRVRRDHMTPRSERMMIDEADSRGNLEEILYGGEEEPVFYGTEIPEMEAN